MLLRVLVALGAGACLAAASEPLGWSWLTPLCVAVLMGAVWRVAPRRAWLPGLAFGIGFFFTLQWWMRAVGPDAWLGLSALEAAFFAPLGAALALVQNRTRAWPVWAAVLWVGIETLRSGWPFSGMPWGRLSYAVADTVWADGLPWFSFTGVSLLLALTGTTLAWTVLERPRAAYVVPAALALLAATVAPTLVPWTPQEHDTATLAVVQGDVPGSGDDLVAVHREVTANHVRATELLALDVEAGREPRPDLVLWPENSTAVDPFRDGGTFSGINRAVDRVGVPVLVGAMVDAEKDHQVLNQGIVWQPQVGAGDRYTKQNPVPFGEYIPWRDVVFRGNLGKLRQIGRDMLSGTRTSPLRAGGVTVADAICFDVAYDRGIHDQVRGGGELLVVQTSNAMFIHTHQIAQQYEITRLRALETGRHVAVAATNGISGVIDARGRPLAEAEPRTTTVLVEEVGLTRDLTPAVRMGEWPGRLVLLGSLVIVVASARRASRMAYIRGGQRPSSRSAE
ncbi:apolipoprotein N-acyltransferase [Nocardioides daphniae]|uniref:Apolipoprotein N-acyltransferase n=1 Tax=Nocardioides daphniae TaxID=402297 RepID=A0A4P7UDB0_9ACTN|nr:apolipoprotein N-acyltransferase [Nocardioides daphniae]QCC77308.1 apolipoprotein N-acyltransferase [Nocardioides daphniae]GGD25442.1 apolipoprotein N-acyltransferase [Nocardioides daphniae]